MTFSIIIPAFNAEDYLQRCLDSIFCQTFASYEVICIDDGSTDSTATILKQYPQVKVISQTNHGMATARNRGLEVAQGDYILFVDSDDQINKDALKTLSNQLVGEDIIEFGSSIFNEETQTITHFHLSPFTSHLCSGWAYFNHERLLPRPVHFVCIWQRAYRRAFLEENNLRFTDGLKRAEDDLFTTMAMFHARSIKTIADYIYTYHVRQGSITRTEDSKLTNDARRVQQLLADTFIPMHDVDKTAIYQVLASNYITLLSTKGNTLTTTEWKQFHQVCVTPRHRRLYQISRISPTLLRIYNTICSSLR